MRFFPEEVTISKLAEEIADDVSWRVGKAVRETLERDAVMLDDVQAAEFVEACLAGDRQLACCLAPRLFKGEALARIDAALVRRATS